MAEKTVGIFLSKNLLEHRVIGNKQLSFLGLRLYLQTSARFQYQLCGDTPGSDSSQGSRMIEQSPDGNLALITNGSASCFFNGSFAK